MRATGALPNEQAIEALAQLTKISPDRLEKLSLAARKAQGQHVSFTLGSSLGEGFRESMAGFPGLFTWGDEQALNGPAIGIVGTRGASPYGKAAAMKFAEAFAKAGVTVVSGGAMGIDAAAHEGAMSAGGKTVAVLPCGVDVAYPAQHKGMFGRIRKQGCLVSQFGLGSKPHQGSFLMRNGVVAALTQAVVIIEAPQQSGALSTAQHAAEMGRTAFVVPGSISQLSFYGSFELIRSGATLVYHPDQILEELGIRGTPTKDKAVPTSGLHERILDQLSDVPIHAEKLCQELGMKTEDLMVELTMLELDGHIIRSSGGICKAP